MIYRLDVNLPLLIFLLALFLFLLLMRTGTKNSFRILEKKTFAALPLSSTLPFSAFPQSFKERFFFLPEALYWLALFFLLTALADPTLLCYLDQETFARERGRGNGKVGEMPTQGIAISLLIDCSGSMDKRLSLAYQTKRKIDWIKEFVIQFLQGDQNLGFPGRDDDLIALTTFARYPSYIFPLTLDQASLKEYFQAVDVVKSDEEEGSSIGYALSSTIAHLLAATSESEAREGGYKVEKKVIILFSDGIESLHPGDEENELLSLSIQEALELAKAKQIIVYMVNVEPKLMTEKFRKYREEMEEAFAATSGKAFFPSDFSEIPQLLREIDRLEKGEIQRSILLEEQPSDYLLDQTIPLRPLFLQLALWSIVLSTCLETLYFKVVP